MTRSLYHWVLTSLLVAWSGSAALASDPEELGSDFFETRIRPVLVERCQECHGGDEVEGELHLDSWPGMEHGGTSGPAVVPGQTDTSLLLKAIRYTDDFYKMPPDGRLSAETVRDFERWVAAGAPVPESFRVDLATQADSTQTPAKPVAPAPDSAEARAYWAFQPIELPRVPAVSQRDWCRTPVDYFVLEGLEQAGLSPAPPVDRRGWLRRVTYDLTGLPPTLEEVDRFLSDTRSDAAERVVERLLSSPRYGEQWGRRWLDVARYADSNGLDENLAYSHAFRYRDYVIDSFNDDLPFDRFVEEQLAGDLMVARGEVSADRRNAAWTATGFLSLGPKMLACDDGRKMELDIIDEQVDTVCRTFMGITMGCARCHDHKFDPFTSGDYYAMAGIFKSTHTMENFNVVAQWHEYDLSSTDELAERQRIEKRLAEIGQLLEEAKKAQPNPPEASPPAETSTRQVDVEGLNRERDELQKQLPPIARAMGVRDGTVTDLPIHFRGNYLTLGAVVERRFPTVLAAAGASSQPELLPSDASGRRELARWLTRPDHPLLARVIVNRVWLGHFGEGLVRTPDNFGRLGLPPTNPQLLDWLAAELIRHGWSLKWLHRQLVLSATYAQSSSWNETSAQRDPENHLWWRYPRQRLTAEQLRDSLLIVSDGLETRMGGQLMPTANREYVTGTGSLEGTYDFPRRSVYLPILRSAVYNVFQAFDFGDPSVVQGQRAVTTVAPQALFAMNGTLVTRASDRLARRIAQQNNSDQVSRRRVEVAYREVLRRDASPDETDRGIEYLDRFAQQWRDAVQSGAVPDGERSTPDDVAALRSLVHVLMASNEFVYLD